jgi:predicted secreted hydrolase
MEFPAAHAPDLDYQYGWHFIVGVARDGQGREYGVQFMLWTHALLPGPVRDGLGLSPIQNQIMEVHLAISPAGDRHYRGAPPVVSGLDGDVAFEPQPFAYRAGASFMESADPAGGLLPLRIVAHAQDRGGDEPVDLSIDFTFDTGKDPFLQGMAGAAPSIGGVGTLYYSVPLLNLRPTGNTLTLGDSTVEIVGGEFWMDHQWGTGIVTGDIFAGNPRDETVRALSTLVTGGPGGWDWFMAQFDGDDQLTLASLHTKADPIHLGQSGPQPPPALDEAVFGTWVDAEGEAHSVTGSLHIDRWVRSERTPDPDDYPVTGTWYPDRWTFTIDGDVPVRMRTFTMSPIVTGGQAGWFAGGVQYSEGAVILHGPDGRVGQGFAESVGYYLPWTPACLALAGLPVEEQTLALFREPHAGLMLKARAAVHLVASAIRGLGRADAD